jgi:hypothetical protein
MGRSAAATHGTPVAMAMVKTDSRRETRVSEPTGEVAAMGGPWRERGFDPASLRSPRPASGARVQAVARSREDEGLGRLILVYIAAVVMSFGLMVAMLQQG